MNPVPPTALALVAALIAAPVLAAPAPSSPQGDWIAAIPAPGGGDQHLAVRISPGLYGGWQGVFDSLEQGSRNIPLANVQADPGRLAFDVPGFQAHYDGQWDEADGAWKGTLRQPQGQIGLEFRPGAIPPAPKVMGLDGDWTGVLPLAGGPEQVVVHVRTDDLDGTVATIDNLTTRVGGMPIAHIEQSGSRVKLEMTAIFLTIEGDLDRGRRTLTGTWTQEGKSTPLTLSRQSKP